MFTKSPSSNPGNPCYFQSVLLPIWVPISLLLFKHSSCKVELYGNIKYNENACWCCFRGVLSQRVAPKYVDAASEVCCLGEWHQSMLMLLQRCVILESGTKVCWCCFRGVLYWRVAPRYVDAASEVCCLREWLQSVQSLVVVRDIATWLVACCLLIEVVTVK